MHEIKLVCLDMDETLIEQNSWYQLNIALGVTPEEDREMYDAYGRGDLSYEEWMSSLAHLYRDRGFATKARVDDALSSYTLKLGARELVLYLKKKGYHLVLLSGSFDVLVDRIADDLRIPLRKGNTSFVFDQKGMIENIVSGGDEPFAKLRNLEHFCRELGISIDQCACVGDGINCVEMFKKTQKGITFTDAPQLLKDVAWKTVSQLSDIKELL